MLFRSRPCPTATCLQPYAPPFGGISPHAQCNRENLETKGDLRLTVAAFEKEHTNMISASTGTLRVHADALCRVADTRVRSPRTTTIGLASSESRNGTYLPTFLCHCGIATPSPCAAVRPELTGPPPGWYRNHRVPHRAPAANAFADTDRPMRSQCAQCTPKPGDTGALTPPLFGVICGRSCVVQGVAVPRGSGRFRPPSPT